MKVSFVDLQATGSTIPPADILNTHIVKVEPIQVISNHEYFVEAVNTCRANFASKQKSVELSPKI